MRFALVVFLFGTAYASTLTPLQEPAPASANWTCAATGFSSDSVAVGLCELKVHTSMRYAQPARYQYSASWTSDGFLTLGALTCYSPAHLGVDHSGCFAMVHYLDTVTTVTIDGYPFWYVTANSLGEELLSNQTGSYWLTP